MKLKDIDNEFWYVIEKIEDIDNIRTLKNIDESKIFSNKNVAMDYAKYYDLLAVHMRGIFLIDINYKSGRNITSLFFKFNYKKKDGDTTLTWLLYEDQGYDMPLYIGINEIESIWVKKKGWIGVVNDEEVYRFFYGEKGGIWK